MNIIKKLKNYLFIDLIDKTINKAINKAINKLQQKIMSQFKLLAYVLGGFGIGSVTSWWANKNNESDKELYRKIKPNYIHKNFEYIDDDITKYLHDHKYKGVDGEFYFINNNDIDSDNYLNIEMVGKHAKIKLVNYDDCGDKDENIEN